MPEDRNHFDLIPAPQIVRERIADNVVEGQVLRRLLKVAEEVAEHKHRQTARMASVERRSRG